ncbi:hypothetical protein GCM10010448_03160 [Streptomyces glomeratus]|uniref:Uncharacterized protein n=1 Tax=Streptomyces glomeratus TaxID=284452 RepID=A0ABN3YB92_9ACTN
MDEVFETCAAIAGSVTPFPERRLRLPVAEAHLVGCADSRLDDLLADDSPFSWLQAAENTAVAELQSWFAPRACDRLCAPGEADLTDRAALLALPQERRWDRSS